MSEKPKQPKVPNIHQIHELTLKGGVCYIEDMWHLMNKGCSNPDCKEDHTLEPFFIHSPCHVASPTWLAFLPDRSTAALLCSECGKPIMFLAIARRSDNQTQTLAE